MQRESEDQLADPQDATLPGETARAVRVGRYRLAAEIATGGMATVYLAVPDDARDSVVALKRVHPHLASQRAFVEMFLDEARITSRIDHPNVCRVLDYGRAEGSYYLTMEYMRGCSLAKVARALRLLPEAEHAIAAPVLAARLIADAAAGLHAAHELTDDRGLSLEVVHRDVSPHNLFVTWDGVLSVLDFGIASARGRMHHTETGTVKGKFAYMAPEQMVGATVDRRADIWSLGVVLWELLAGRPLFKRRTETETVIAVSSLDRPSLASLRPGIPRALEIVVERALARDPDGRYPSAQTMADDLLAWLATQPGPGDAAEVAAWMHTLFPGQAAEDDQRVRMALAQLLPHVGDPTTQDRSGVVRRGEDRPHRTTRLAFFVLALFLSIAIGALAALWPRAAAPRAAPADAPARAGP